MPDKITENEVVILGAVLGNRPEGIKSLHTLSISEYTFSENYRKIADYLLEKSLNPLRAGLINKAHFCHEFSFNEQQLDFFLEQGKQDVRPSFDYLIEHKFVSDKLRVFNGYKALSMREPLTLEQLAKLEIELSSVSPLRRILSQEEIDAKITDDFNKRLSGEEIVYQTGIDTYDNMMHGLSPEEILVIGGFSGTGKTQLATQIALSVLEQGGRVCFVSAENSETQVKIRFAAHKAEQYEVSINDPSSEAAQKILAGARFLTSEYGAALTIAKIRDFDDACNFMKIRAAANMDDVYIMDYLQLFTTKKKTEGNYDMLNKFTEKIVAFATDYRKPQIIVSQTLKDETETYMGSGFIRQMATSACIIYRDKNITEARFGANDYYKTMVAFNKSRGRSRFNIYGKVYPSDPRIRDIDVTQMREEDIEEWNNLMPKPTRRW